MSSSSYEFDWDDAKADANARKHGVRLEQAMSVFRDPLALTVYDEEHSTEGERWVTIGCIESGETVIVVHDFTQTSPDNARIRLIQLEVNPRLRRGTHNGLTFAEGVNPFV